MFALAAMATVAKSAAAASTEGLHVDYHSSLGGAAGNCITQGEVCVNHCLTLLSTGDTSLGACAKSANQMLAVCTALQGLANQDSKHLPALAKVALVACQECADECKKHEVHTACKNCRDACLATIAEIKKIPA
jgi:Cys-rich four helix bundle protein (predicted Tat secretion target)